MADVDEYLEKLFSEGFKREIDSDESVWRTLPFFATAIGITGTLLGYDGSQLPRPALQPLTVLLYVLFLASITCLAASFAWLFNAVRQRTYRYPPSEVDLYRLASDYREYERARGFEAGALEAQVLRYMRSVMVEEYAQAASSNRDLNRAKLFSRSQAIFYLMAGLAICFAYGSLAFMQQKLAPPSEKEQGRADGQRRTAQQPITATAGPRNQSGTHSTAQASAANDPRRSASVCPLADPRGTLNGRPAEPNASASAACRRASSAYPPNAAPTAVLEEKP